MTIVSNFLPTQSPWDYMDMVWNWGSGNNFNTPSHQHRHIQDRGRDHGHPIHIVDDNGFQESFQSHLDPWEEWSDSDCDDFDLNNSSTKVGRKRQHSKPEMPNCSNASPLNRRLSSTLESISEEDVPEKKDRKRSYEDLKASYDKRNARPTFGIDKVPQLILTDSEERQINETCNYSVYEYLKESLSREGRQIDAIRGDGNCFFRALSKILYGNQTYYEDLRQAVVEVLQKNPRKFEAFTDGPIQEHILDMSEDKTWATQTEIYAAATLLNRDIYILSPDQTGEKYRWLLFQPQLKYNSMPANCQCYLTICHTHGNHYDRIAPIGDDCNCYLEPPEMTGFKGHVDLTSNDEIV